MKILSSIEPVTNLLYLVSVIATTIIIKNKKLINFIELSREHVLLNKTTQKEFYFNK